LILWPNIHSFLVAFGRVVELHYGGVDVPKSEEQSSLICKKIAVFNGILYQRALATVNAFTFSVFFSNKHQKNTTFYSGYVASANIPLSV